MIHRAEPWAVSDEEQPAATPAADDTAASTSISDKSTPARSETTPARSESTPSGTETPSSRAAKRELALELLAHLEHDELDLSAVIDRIETVTTSPALTREILDTAEKRGLIDRNGARIHTSKGGSFVRFESQVVAREGDFACRRCGAGLSTGHFIRFEAGELGPFGSSCIRKVVGREG